jgi:hypothetical protein
MVTSSTFSGWSRACTGDGDGSLTMNSAQAVTTTFTLDDTNYEVCLPLIVRAAP